MNIKPGPKIQKYADIVGADVSEVVKWVSGYVNGPWSKSVEPYIEKTENDRLKSIQDYISLRIETAISSQIKAEMDIERMKVAVEKEKPVYECPF